MAGLRAVSSANLVVGATSYPLFAPARSPVWRGPRPNLLSRSAHRWARLLPPPQRDRRGPPLLAQAFARPPRRGTKIERHRRPNQGWLIGLPGDLVECPQPLGPRHPPKPLAGQHAVVVDADPAPCEALVHVRPELLEVCVHLGAVARLRVRICQGIVLVGRERELSPGGAPQIEPRPQKGSSATAPDREID